MNAARPVSLNHCTTSHRSLSDPIHLDINRTTPGDRRRKRLRTGIDRWHLSVCASKRPVKRVLLGALTFRDPDVSRARGSIQQFWKHYRRLNPNGRYFSWAELQLRGALHYHFMMIDPPWKLERQARAWIQAHWPHAGIQPSVQWRDATWFRKAAGRYVKAYAKKPLPPRRSGGLRREVVPDDQLHAGVAAGADRKSVV